MPWTKSDYPNSMKNLPVKVRNKAVEIANALINEGKMDDEGIIIATATSRAKDWAVNHGEKIAPTSKDAKSTDVKKHGQDMYVVPADDAKWAVKKEGSKRVEKTFTKKAEAISRATTEAKQANSSVTIQKRTGKVEKRTSYNPHNSKK